jgi:alpha/beta superfamily hydrolase
VLSGSRRSLLDLPEPFYNSSYVIDSDITFARSNHTLGEKVGDVFYIPGLDLTGLGVYQHIFSLNDEYDLHTLVVGNRGIEHVAFDDFRCVVEYMNSIDTPNWILIGESFGATIALTNVNDISNVRKVILMNPATTKPYATVVNALLSETDFYKLVLNTIFAKEATVKDMFGVVEHVIKLHADKHVSIISCLFFIITNMITTTRGDILRRMEAIVYPGLERLETVDYSKVPPTHIVAGRRDQIVPSVAEAKRLKKLISTCTVTVKNVGHVLTVKNVNLKKLIQ